MSKGNQGNRAHMQNADIVQFLCEEKVKWRWCYSALSLFFHSTIFGWKVFYHFRYVLRPSSMCSICLGQKCTGCPLLLCGVSHVESLLSITFPTQVQRLSCLILVFYIKEFVMPSIFILELTTSFINVRKNCRQEVINACYLLLISITYIKIILEN